MKGILLVAMAVCFLLCSCKTSDTQSQISSVLGNSNSSNSSDTSDDVATSVELATPQTVEIITNSDEKYDDIYETSTWFMRSSFVDPDAKKNKTVNIYGKEYQVTYVETLIHDNGKNDVLRRGVECYKGSEISVEFLKGTEQITALTMNTPSSSAEKEFSEDEIKNIAEDFMSQVMSEEEFSKYKSYIIRCSEDSNYWDLKYRRESKGHQALEVICLGITSTGEVQSYEAFNLCAFDYANPNITKEHIDAAISSAKAQLQSKADLTNSQTLAENPDSKDIVRLEFDSNGLLVIDSNGDLYVNMVYTVCYDPEADKLQTEYDCSIYVKVG